MSNTKRDSITKMTRKFLFIPFDMLTNFLILQHQQVWLTLTHHCAISYY